MVVTHHGIAVYDHLFYIGWILNVDVHEQMVILRFVIQTYTFNLTVLIYTARQYILLNLGRFTLQFYYYPANNEFMGGL